MKYEININENGISMMKAKTLIDPETNEEVIAERHREAVGLFNHVPLDANGEPDLSDQAAVDAAKEKARGEIKALIEDVTGPDFADLVGRIKAAEDERDIAKTELAKMKGRNK